MKKCTKCKKLQDVSNFHRDRTRSDGLNAKCKKCTLQTRHEKVPKLPTKVQFKYDWSDNEAKCVYSWNNTGQAAGLPGLMTVEQWKNLLKVYNYACAYCKHKEPKLQPDHYYPRSWIKNPAKQHLVTSDVSNCRPACSFCNRAKSDVDPIEFLAWLAEISCEKLTTSY